VFNIRQARLRKAAEADETPPPGLLNSCSKRNSPEPLNLSISKTADEVVVHHADRLHVRIHDGRTDEAESALLEILAERVGFA
jgi:hypothetical protein